MVYLSLGDLFGFLALALISLTALLMFARRFALRQVRDLDRLRRVHIVVAAAGGFFLILHVAYFLYSPLVLPVVLGYFAAAGALVVWLTGSAFLARLRDSLFFHGAISFAAIALMVIHACSAGANLPETASEYAIGATVFVLLLGAFAHVSRLLPRGASPE
ncbi:MAG TPA: hypothetical protein VEJ36_07350 [Nitrososphaerales archaeon]|nr:hypothetical protein [Nitrososphaerales archaeon]